MYSVLVILAVVASVFMCLIVLIQESKGGGLASSFAENNSMLGVRKTTDVVEKITWGLAIAMVVLSVVSVAFLQSPSAEQSVMQATPEETSVPAMEAGTSNAAAGEAAPAAATTPAPVEE